MNQRSLGNIKISPWLWASMKDKGKPVVKPKGWTESLSVEGRELGELPNRAVRITVGGSSLELGAGFGEVKRVGKHTGSVSRVQGLFQRPPPGCSTISVHQGLSEVPILQGTGSEMCTEIQQVGRAEVDPRPRPKPVPFLPI